METITHSELVKTLAKPGDAILKEMTPHQCNIQHMAIGICGEAGELIDAVKKNSVYQKPLDRENIIEELGDIEFYMEGLRQALDITREETLVHNVAKLSERFKGLKYSNKAAQERRDKKEKESS